MFVQSAPPRPNKNDSNKKALKIRKPTTKELNQVETIITGIIGPGAAKKITTFIAKLINILVQSSSGDIYGDTNFLPEFLAAFSELKDSLVNINRGGTRKSATKRQIADLVNILKSALGLKNAKAVANIIAILIDGLLGKIPIEKLLRIVYIRVYELRNGSEPSEFAIQVVMREIDRLRKTPPPDILKDILIPLVGADIAEILTKLFAILLDALLGKISPADAFYAAITFLVTSFFDIIIILTKRPPDSRELTQNLTPENQAELVDALGYALKPKDAKALVNIIVATINAFKYSSNITEFFILFLKRVFELLFKRPISTDDLEISLLDLRSRIDKKGDVDYDDGGDIKDPPPPSHYIVHRYRQRINTGRGIVIIVHEILIAVPPN